MRFFAVVWMLMPLALLGQSALRLDPAAAERGRSQFKSSCGFCHGEDATGNRAPDLVRSVTVGHDVDGDLLAPLIRNGMPDKGMPGFSTLTPAQISDIAVFLHQRALDALHTNHIPSDYPLAKLLTGNATAGKAYFNGAGGCAGCHSPTGDLAGVAGKYSPLELQQKFLYPGAKAAKPTATVTLKDGSKVEGTVAHVDEFTIAITGKDGWYRSWDLSRVKVAIHDPLAAHRALMPKYADADIHDLFAYLETLK
jgi:cytochrome c oxidase cbb3-type subunit III